MKGGAMVVDLPPGTECSSLPGRASGLIQPECVNATAFRAGTIADPTAYPLYQAVRSHLGGESSSLPRTSADVTQPVAPTCTPACVWGTCISVGGCGWC